MATEYGSGVSESFLRERDAVKTEIARNTSSEAFARIYHPGFPSRDVIERERAKKTTEQAFLSAVDHLIEQRQIPTAEAIAADVGCPLEEAAEWLEIYTKNRVSHQEGQERARIQRGTDAQRRVNAAERAFREAEETLRRSRDAKHLPAIDLDDPYLETTDPLIATAIRLRDELASVKRQHSYMAELSQTPGYAQVVGQNQDIRRDQVKAAVANVTDAMRNYDKTRQRSQELVEQMARIERQIARNREQEQASHAHIIRQHAEYWRLTGELMRDYAIPPKPGVEADANTQKVKPAAKR